MTSQQLYASIGRIEQYYTMPYGSIRKSKKPKMMPRKRGGVNLPSIRQVLAIYFFDELNMTMEFIANLLGFKERSGVYKAVFAGRRHFKNKDYKFMQYHETVIGLVTKTIPAKNSKEFREQAERYINQNRGKTNKQLAKDLGISVNCVNVYLRTMVFDEDVKPPEVKSNRPPTVYSNQNRALQYFEGI